MRGNERGIGNELSGTVHGPTVQAGVVSGDIHLHPPQAPTAPSPWQLPAPVSLTDRRAELRALQDHRLRAEQAGRPTFVAICGLGGMGKTALASAWLHALRPAYPAGQLYADLGAQSPAGPTSPAEVLSRFLRALGVAPAEVPSTLAERTTLYRSLTAERELVVLLDDAVSAAQVRPLLPGGRTVTAVTGRGRMPGLTVDGCYTLHLGSLPADAAMELLAATLHDERVTAQPDDARALVELCGGLPLAVRVAGARLAAHPRRRLTTMVRALTEAQDRLGALAIEGDHNVRAALDDSYRSLPDGAARLYRLLSLHPGSEFGGAAATAALGADAAESLELLHEVNLLIDTGDDRYRFHDLVRLHAREHAGRDEPPAERDAALRRIADHYLASATRAEELVDPQHRTLARDYGPGTPVLATDLDDDPDSALDWLERELPTLMALVRLARPAGFPTVAWQLADALWPLFLRRKFSDQGRAAHEEGLAAARELGDGVAECRMLTSGGMGELGSGGHERALEMFERAADLFRERGDLLGQARALNYRGLACRRLGRLDEAADGFGRAAAELPRCGDPRAGALARLNLAEISLLRDDADAAAEGAESALGTLTDCGDSYNAARAAVLLGQAHLALDHLDLAEAHLGRAHETLRGAGAAYECARALTGLGRTAERRGRPDTARRHYEDAVALFASAGRGSTDEAVAARAALDGLPASPG